MTSGRMTITKAFVVQAAHRLPMVPEGHKCHRLHGHNFKILISLRGPVREDGFVADFADITSAFEPLRKQLDHEYLNDIPGLENPTSENLCLWLYQNLIEALGELLFEITVYENETAKCVYRVPQAVPT